MQKRQVALWLFVPANEQPAKAIHPGARPLHDPPARFEASHAFDRLGLFPTRAHMRGEAKLLQNGIDLIIVITCIQNIPCGRSAVGSGRATATRSRVGRVSFMSCRLAPSTTRPIGTPCPSESLLRLTPDSASVGGIGSGFFPAQWSFRQCPIQRQPVPLDPARFVKSFNPSSP